MKNYLLKLMKSRFKSDDFGRGKTVTAKRRNKLYIKRSSKTKLNKALDNSED